MVLTVALVVTVVTVVTIVTIVTIVTRVKESNVEGLVRGLCCGCWFAIGTTTASAAPDGAVPAFRLTQA